jgi:hypothetical protein
MKADSIQKYLKPYRMAGRASTITNMFVSAIAPTGKFEKEVVEQAMRELELDPNDLKCVYCEKEAATWDHLNGLVKNKEFSGYGHQIGNLVPACRTCNESKGGKKFEDFILLKSGIASVELVRRLEAHQKNYAQKFDLVEAKRKNPDLWQEFEEQKIKMMDALRAAEKIAERIRQEFIS